MRRLGDKTNKGGNNMNKVILMGRLARDPDVRSTQGGKTVARMTLAVDRRKGADGQQEADFLALIAWEKIAEIAANYLHKGSKILVEGRLQSRSYEAQDGSKRYVTEVIVQNLEFCESRRQETGQDTTMGATGQFGRSVSDRDIPF